jgi:3-hydroxyisobutyrate dehydrogenase-like beta-hydroxyacid dehydrogenase
MKIGFIGLGQMGFGMATNLIKAGHAVAVFNRSPGKGDALVAAGALRAGSVADACRGEAVFTMLANDAAVEDIALGADGIVTHLAPGAVHISASTISVRLARRLAQVHATARQRFVAAPVFGRPAAAAARQLYVVAAGAADAIRIVEPLLEAIGQRSFFVGDQPERANLVKLSGNFLIGSVIEALGEAMALITKGGIDRQEYLEILTSTLFNAPVYKTYGRLIADRAFEPAGFAAPLGSKDIRLALEAADDLQVPMPIASLLRDRFLTLLAQGGAHLDWSAVAALAERDAGGGSM